ncbi:MAG: NAD-dependent epimerase/dehydratase family protein [Pseudomonadota bacterium]
MYRSRVRKPDFHSDTQHFFAGRRVAIFGGSGFIGSHVVEMLLELGASPVVLSRSTTPPFLSHLTGQVEVIAGDLRDYEAATRTVRGCSVVLNLAAMVAGIEWNANHPASMFMNNMGIFFNAVRASVDHRVERLLVTSSACVYPRHCSVPTPESEGFLDVPEPTNAGYGWAKRMEEFLGAAAAQEYGISVAIARPYNAYGPRDDFDPQTSHVIPALIRKALESTDGSFKVWGDGSHSRSFLYVDDFARGLIEVAARYPEADAVNIGTPEEVTIRDVATNIASIASEILGRSISPTFDPQGLTGQPRRACDITKAVNLLDYRARVPLSDGLRTTMDWYISCTSHSAS